MSRFQAAQQWSTRSSVGFEDVVREPVVAQELPDVFDRIELGHFGGSGMMVMLASTIRRVDMCEEQDHPPLGQPGTRPIAPRDQRTASTYIFGAVCPKDGKGAALILPTCNTEAMNLHL